MSSGQSWSEGPSSQRKEGNGGKGGSSGEESMDLCKVVQTLQEVAKKLGGLAKGLSSPTSQDQDPYLRRKVTLKLQAILFQVRHGVGSHLDLSCLLRCINGVAQAAKR